MRRGAAGLLGGLLLLGGAGAWRWGPDLVARIVYPQDSGEGATSTPIPVDVARVQQVVRTSFPSAGLMSISQTGEFWTEREDVRGRWRVYEGTWQLEEGQDPQDVARRLRSLVSGVLAEADVYLVPTPDMGVEVRVYAGTRLASYLRFEPTLTDWPALPSEVPPLLVTVIVGLEETPGDTRAILATPSPLALALQPFSPFTLRLARDAVAAHKEVLVAVGAGQSLDETVQAVPHATGVLLSDVPSGEAETGARDLRKAGLYVIDATEAGLPAAWIRALRAAEVPFVRVVTPGGEGQRQRLQIFRHTAVQTGGAVLVVSAGDPERETLLQSLEEAAINGYRPAFAAELVAAQEGRTGGRSPGTRPTPR